MKNFWHQVKAYWSWENLNPLNWSNREIKLFLSAFFAIMLPIYLFIGFQPAPIVNASSLPKLEISSIALETPVTAVTLVEHEFIVPAQIAGYYTEAENKIFIMGHSSTVFKNLDKISTGDAITYREEKYIVQAVETLPKADISMSKILQAEEEETLIIMTCAGEPLPNQDATHRLIVTAIKA